MQIKKKEKHKQAEENAHKRSKTLMGCEKLTKKKARALFKEEKMSAKEWRKLGYPSFAKDEEKHARLVKKCLK